MKFYWCAFLLAACGPRAWGGDAARLLYHIDTVAGSGRIGDGGPAIAAQFSNINGIAVDRLGNLYLSDTDNHRVRKVSLSGIVTTIAGTGAAGFSGDGGAAVSAQLNLPYGLALDGASNLYVADYGNLRVRRIGTDGVITTVAGSGRNASSPDGLPPLETSLLYPRNVAVDAKGNLYIAEFKGHRVRMLTPEGKLTTIAGKGLAGLAGDGSPAVNAQLNGPAGMAFDRAGALYICDSANNRVRKIIADGTIVTVLGGLGSQLFGPLGIALDAAGTMYVGDFDYRVVSYTAAGKFAVYAGSGVPGFFGDGGPAKEAALNHVNGLAMDVNGSLYIADGGEFDVALNLAYITSPLRGGRVRRVSPTAIIDTVAGDGYMHAVGDGDVATAALLYQPEAVALDAMGNLYVADPGTDRVREVTPNGQMTTLAGTGLIGLGNMDGAPAATTALYSPTGLALDAAGNLLVADSYNHRILQITPAHLVHTIAGTAGMSGTSAEGLPPLAAALNGPQGVCLDRAGALYIVDSSNHRVLRLPAGGVMQTVAGNGSMGYAGDTGPARFAQLNMPAACAFDSAGNLFIADTGNHSIRKVAADGAISTVAGAGIPGASGDGGAAASARLSLPRGLAVDDSGNIFIGDTGNNRIRIVTPDGVIHTIAGTGAAGFAGDTGAAADALLNGPAGLILDGSGALYFADNGNNRIRHLTPDVAPPPPVTFLPQVAVVNAMSLRTGAIAPGEIVSIFGGGLGPNAGVTASLDATGALPTVLGAVEVRINSVSSPIFYAQAAQINAQVPYSILGSDTVDVLVVYQGKPVGGATVKTAPSAPALLALAINQDGATNAESAPAARGGWMTFYATGEGLNDGARVAGVPADAPYAHPLLPIALKIAGVSADILYAGSAPGMVGVMQVNARVPAGFVAGGAAQVELTVGDVSAPQITVWLK